MSITIVDKERFDRAGKFFSTKYGKETSRQIVHKLHVLNCMNYAIKYNDGDENIYYDDPSLFNVDLPLHSHVQYESDLSSIWYNCLDNGEDIDSDLLEFVESELNMIRDSIAYKSAEHLYKYTK